MSEINKSKWFQFTHCALYVFIVFKRPRINILLDSIFESFIFISVRLVLFCTIWMCTLGKHHFWFLPNLNEDVGFIDSFLPLYKHETYTPKPKDSDKKGKGSDKDDADAVKSSGANNSDSGSLGSNEAKTTAEVISAQDSVTPGINADEEISEKTQSERGAGSGGTESEPSDDQEGFELVDKEDLTEEEDDEEEEDEAGDEDKGQNETKKDK